MSDLSGINAPNSLAEWAERNKKQVDSQQAPIDGQTVAPEPPESQTTPAAVEATTEQEPKTEDAVLETETPKSWDTDDAVAEPTKTTPLAYDFTKTGSALGWGEIKDESDFLAKATTLNTKLKELEEAPLKSIPEDLREVIEVARKDGANWKDYLSQQVIDYSKVNPLDLYEDEFFRRAEKDPKYFTDGKYDESLALAELERIPEAVQFGFGQQIQQLNIQEQKRRQAEIRAKAEAKIANAETSLSQATQKLSEILPLEQFGIKFEPKHSVEIYNGITNSTLTKKHLGVTYEKLVESGADMKQIARTITLAEKGEKFIKYGSETAESRAKKALLDKTQNAQLNTPGSTIRPEDPKSKVLSPAEKLAYHIANQKKTGL